MIMTLLTSPTPTLRMTLWLFIIISAPGGEWEWSLWFFHERFYASVIHSWSDSWERNGHGNEKLLSKLLWNELEMKNSFPAFRNGNGRLVFPEMVGNRNSRSPGFCTNYFLLHHCLHSYFHYKLIAFYLSPHIQPLPHSILWFDAGWHRRAAWVHRQHGGGEEHSACQKYQGGEKHTRGETQKIYKKN